MKIALACVLAAVGPFLIAPPSFAQPGPPGGMISISTVPGAPSSPGVQMPPRDAAQPKAGTARIRGRVVAADTGTPLRKALVRINAPDLREGRTATTDADGRYESADLPASRYQLTAAKGSYVTLQYEQRRPFQPGAPLQSEDGQTLEKVDFALPRGSVITGRVLDEFGEPMSDVRSVAMRKQYGPNGRRLMPAGRGATTNDIGEFRLFGLPPGQYYVSASLVTMMAPDADESRSGYAAAFYPAAANQADAQPVTVGLGETANDINITLVPIRTARISGAAYDAEGRPMRGGNVMVMEQQAGGIFMSLRGGAVHPDGTFSISGLPPGTYTLRAMLPPDGSTMPVAASALVTVAGEDVSGVQLVVQKTVKITGRIVAATAEMQQALSGAVQRIGVIPLDDSPPAFGAGSGSGPVADDGSFSLSATPGRVMLRPMTTSAEWTVRAARVNGADVTDGLELKAGEDLSGVEIELTNRLSEISGIVRDAHGAAPHDYTTLAFARDPQQRGPMSRRVSLARPDQDGRFKVRGLPPGDYYIVALDDLEPGESRDPDLLQRVRASAREITIGDGETKTIDLTLTSVQ